MNAEIKEKWIKALESGDYIQGQGGLRIKTEEGPDKFCCLGVLVDIINPEQWREENLKEVWYKGQQIHVCGFEDLYQTDYIPYHTAEEIGLDTQNQTELANMNDEGKTFSEIAEEIKKRL